MLSDKELIEEVRKRFDENENAIHDLRAITKRLEDVNRKLLESESMKSNFLSNIRNEINNPLTSIMGISTQILDDESLSHETIKSMANMIYSEAFSLDFQLRNIFAAAELEAGETILSVYNVDIDKLVRSCVDLSKQKANEKNITINYFFESNIDENDNAFFKADTEKLQLILMNLLINAIEYSHDNGLVELKLVREYGLMKFSAKDHGIGIDISDQEVIFNRFKQLDTGIKKSHRGHGLGLSIIKALAEMMGGTITVISERGKGSVFALSIPEMKREIDVNDFAEGGNVFVFGNEREL